MCCRFYVETGDEIPERIFSAYDDQDHSSYQNSLRGHHVDPLKFMEALKGAVGYANTLIREGVEGVTIEQLGDPCPLHEVLPPFDLKDFCTVVMKKALNPQEVTRD